VGGTSKKKKTAWEGKTRSNGEKADIESRGSGGGFRGRGGNGGGFPSRDGPKGRWASAGGGGNSSGRAGRMGGGDPGRGKGGKNSGPIKSAWSLEGGLLRRGPTTQGGGGGERGGRASFLKAAGMGLIPGGTAGPRKSGKLRESGRGKEKAGLGAQGMGKKGGAHPPWDQRREKEQNPFYGEAIDWGGGGGTNKGVSNGGKEGRGGTDSGFFLMGLGGRFSAIPGQQVLPLAGGNLGPGLRRVGKRRMR